MSKPEKFPKVSSLSKPKVDSLAFDMYKGWKICYRVLELHKEIIEKLSGMNSEHFCEETEDGAFLLHEDRIAEFRKNNSGAKEAIHDNSGPAGEKCAGSFENETQIMMHIAKLNSRVDELERENSFLQLENKNVREKGMIELKRAESELARIKSTSPIQQQREMIEKLSLKRKHLPLEKVSGANPNGVLMTQLFSTEYMGGEGDAREELFMEQREVEIQVINNLLTILREKFDDFPTGLSKANYQSLELDIYPILDAMMESRTKLSYIVPESYYKDFLQNHLVELKEIITVYNSRMTDGSVSLRLSPYEKFLLLYKEGKDCYLNCYEKRIEMQKRLLYSSRLSNKLVPFQISADISSVHLFCPIEDVIKSIVHVSHPINNVVYIPLKTSTGPDYFSFYYLAGFQDTSSGNTRKRIWKLDPHLLHVTRSFADKYSREGSKVFKLIYKDVFGHNNYINKFEQVIESKQVEFWKQAKILYENLQICSDEYLLGEIARKIVRTIPHFYPKEETDIVQGDRDTVDASNDFKRVRERLKLGMPAQEEEPEDYMYNCFDNCSKWSRHETSERYKERWKTWLQKDR